MLTLPPFDFKNILDVFTGTIYGEIRGGTVAAQQNVAQVILNRQHRQPHKTIADICLEPYQFSCWLASDPNRSKIISAPQREPTLWLKLKAVTEAAVAGRNPDNIKGALNYFATSMAHAPKWAQPPAVVTLNDGFHVFVRLDG